MRQPRSRVRSYARALRSLRSRTTRASGGRRTRGWNLRSRHPRRAAVTRRSAPAEHEGPSSVVRPSSCPELATHTVVKSGLLRVGRSHRVAGAERGCDGMERGGIVAYCLWLAVPFGARTHHVPPNSL